MAGSRPLSSCACVQSVAVQSVYCVPRLGPWASRPLPDCTVPGACRPNPNPNPTQPCAGPGAVTSGADTKGQATGAGGNDVHYELVDGDYQARVRARAG